MAKEVKFIMHFHGPTSDTICNYIGEKEDNGFISFFASERKNNILGRLFGWCKPKIPIARIPIKYIERKKPLTDLCGDGLPLYIINVNCDLLGNPVSKTLADINEKDYLINEKEAEVELYKNQFQDLLRDKQVAQDPEMLNDAIMTEINKLGKINQATFRDLSNFKR